MRARRGIPWFGPPAALAAAAACAACTAFAAVAVADVGADLAAARRHADAERWAASESLATAALARLEAAPAPDSLAIAEALELVGTARWRTVGYADGSGLAAASRALGIRERAKPPVDPLALADVHALVARFLPESGKPDSAITHLRRALALREARLAPDDTTLAKTWDQLALIQRNRGDMRGALASWEQAIAIRKRAHGPEHPEVARLLAQTGVPWMELGDLDRARAVLEESLNMFARTSGLDDPRRWIPLNILGDVEKRSGNHVRDADLLQEAMRIVRPAYGEDSREMLTLRSNLAVVLFELNDPAGSLAVYAETLPLVRAQYGPAHPRTLNLVHGMALCSRLAGDLAEAERLLVEIDSLFSTREDPRAGVQGTIQGQLADVLYLQGRDTESRAMGERAVRTVRGAKDLPVDQLVGTYRALLPTLAAIGDTAALAKTVTEMFDVERQYGMRTTSAGPNILLNAAGAERRLGRDEDAWNHALEAERLSSESVRLNLLALPDRRALRYTRMEGRFLDYLLLLARDGDPSRAETAWDRLVRARGAVRAESSRRRVPAGLAADTALAGFHVRWLVAQRKWAQRLVRAGGAPRDSAARVALDRLRFETDAAEGAYAGALAARGSAVPAASVGLADVRARLRDGQALVGCVEAFDPFGRRAPARVFAFVARGGRDGIEVIDFGDAPTLHAVLDPWRSRLAVSPGPRARRDDPSEKDCRRLGQAARKATWDRLAPLLDGVTDVFLVPDGSLSDLPWGALPEGARNYLVESGPRLHVLHAERDLVDPKNPMAPGALLALGAPDYDRDGAGATPRATATTSSAVAVRSVPDPCASRQLPAFTALPRSGEEAEAVARTWQSTSNRRATVLLGAAASEEAFKREASGRAILHLATHGVVAGDLCADPAPGARGVGGLTPVSATVPAAASRPRPAANATPASIHVDAPTSSPWMSRRVWLALAGANQAATHQADENEGLLTAEEVLMLDLAGTDWVVLSACHSGLAEAWSREGTLGMRRAFDLAGARTVIASQWAVEDAATLEWMRALYAARASGATTGSAALEAANRVVLAARRQDGRSTHPFYWAAFGASGE